MASYDIIQWFEGACSYSNDCTCFRCTKISPSTWGGEESAFLLFGPPSGLFYRDMDGVIKEGNEIVTDASLGTRFQRGRWIRRLQGRIHKKCWMRVMKSTLLCLPHRLGQNAWVRIGQFIRRKPTPFLALVGLAHLGTFVGIVKTFVNHRRTWRHRRVCGLEPRESVPHSRLARMHPRELQWTMEDLI
jgi:hypothetical protein